MPGFELGSQAIERTDPAAALLGAALIIGITLVFGGGDTSEGTSWLAVLLRTLLGVPVLLWNWIQEVRLSGSLQRIIVDHETAAAWRAAGLLIGNGVILGRAVTGE